MSKELPKMYVNKIENDLRNNQNSFSSYSDKTNVLEENNRSILPSKPLTKKELEQKIYRILDPKKYIYKANVNIVTENEILQKKIVGYVNQNIITYDQEKISIDKIKDIYLEKK